MNTQIQSRTTKKLQENQTLGKHSWTFNTPTDHADPTDPHKYTVLPQVFSPAVFLGTEWLTHQILKRVDAGVRFLEIGGGVGVTSIQLALRDRGRGVIGRVVCVDVNCWAVEAIRINVGVYGVDVEVKESDVFSNIPLGSPFDIIYWNFPFHPSSTPPQTLTLLQKAVKDPGYQLLHRFLASAAPYLTKGGIMYLGFSEVMGDMGKLRELCQMEGWQVEVLDRMDVGGKPMICLLELCSKEGNEDKKL